MATSKLPAVHLSVVNGGECITPDGVVVELPASNKFSVSWPSDTRAVTTPPAQERMSLSFSENDSETSDGDSGNEQRDTVEAVGAGGRKQEDAHAPVSRKSAAARSLGHPRLSRALSMPTPSQLGYLKHPHRSDSVLPSKEPLSYPTTPDTSRLKELSVELADSVQMMIQTMLQISPPQLLDPAKEQFSACSLSVPTPSISAMLTSMKNLNYISANMHGLCSEVEVNVADMPQVGAPEPLSDFDIGEMMQSVGDSLSGAASQAGVDLVIYHGDDIGLRHVCVKGNESGISYALSHDIQVARQVLATAQPGDSIELGLHVCSSGTQMSSHDQISPIEAEPLSCTIRISHKFAAELAPLSSDSDPGAPARPQPSFSSLILRQLLRQIGVLLTSDLPPPKTFLDGRTCEFTLSLTRGSLSVLNTPIVSLADEDSTGEPSVEQLTLFAEGLKGKRVAFYANAKGSFAQHLSSFLTAWGMDVTHISPNGEVDGLPDVPSSPTTLMPPSTYAAKAENSPSFIFIDDDIEVLKERLFSLRAEKPYQMNLSLRKRPSLAANHRPRSSPQVARAMGMSQTSTPLFIPVVIVHFTSLANYKMVKDIIQSVVTSYAGAAASLPEVMIIPKPAGPRRFLAALHTAVTKPTVDPIFQPIATSPTSPHVDHEGSFFNSYHHAENNNPRTPQKATRPSSSRSNSDRSTKSAKDTMDLTAHRAPPSPLAMCESVEYFAESTARLGKSPSSGLVIQSPDGQPAGILFNPRGKSPRNPPPTMERDKGHLNVPESKRRPSRLSVSTADPISFSSLHAVATPKPAVESWNAASPSVRAAARKASGASEESTPSASSFSLPRKSPASEAPRKPTSPGSQENAPSRRGTPRRAAQQEPAAPSPSAALAAASKRVKAAADGNIVPPISVLIVDDNPINQTILSTFMKKKKIKYDLANNGQEAVQKWLTGGFHLILMDIQMPIMDGIQATKEIRRLEQLNAVAGYPPGTPSFDGHSSPLRTPSETSSDPKSVSSPFRSAVIIVALTASSLQSDRVAALAAGCNDFLTKPVSLLWLNSKIIEWGSIKALQMWAEVKPPDVSAMATEQAAQARNVADRLHVPQARTTPSPSRQVGSPTIRAPQPVSGTSGSALAGLPASAPGTTTTYWGELSTPPAAMTPKESAKDLARGGRRATISLASAAESLHASGVTPPASTSDASADRQQEVPPDFGTVDVP
ncbi:hypothetical protein DXG03_001264 [Asterophora parasitica]|uniref:Response regulatory domain-containing protein n=1 Tax=Asterophora parasitica TaxID=117018 RepID=A0A9P7G3N3_9AGAR|nr:hypothetical protein DXG03_001264 [Asterophora parasitica]